MEHRRRERRTMTDVNDLLETWLANATDSELAAELARMKKSGDATAVNDAFYQDLEFGHLVGARKK